MVRIAIVISLILLISCKPLPSKKLSQWKADLNYYVSEDSLFIEIGNPLQCPLRIGIKSADDSIQMLLKQDFPLLLPPAVDTVFAYRTDKEKSEISLRFSGTMGDPESKIDVKKISLPFPENKQYKIIQGYNGKFSHSSEYSRYALDFNLVEGDTICSVADGYVVGVIEDYQYGGNAKKWRDYANFITIFHPEMNMYTQYVHLTHKGSFVNVGDQVKSGQMIGLSGLTGYTSVEHLHFNVLVASENGMKSIPIEFKEGYRGVDLKEGDIVIKRSR